MTSYSYMTLAIYPKINENGIFNNDTKPPISPSVAVKSYYSNVAIS